MPVAEDVHTSHTRNMGCEMSGISEKCKTTKLRHLVQHLPVRWKVGVLHTPLGQVHGLAVHSVENYRPVTGISWLALPDRPVIVSPCSLSVVLPSVESFGSKLLPLSGLFADLCGLSSPHTTTRPPAPGFKRGVEVRGGEGAETKERAGAGGKPALYPRRHRCAGAAAGLENSRCVFAVRDR